MANKKNEYNLYIVPKMGLSPEGAPFAGSMLPTVRGGIAEFRNESGKKITFSRNSLGTEEYPVHPVLGNNIDDVLDVCKYQGASEVKAGFPSIF